MRGEGVGGGAGAFELFMLHTALETTYPPAPSTRFASHTVLKKIPPPLFCHRFVAVVPWMKDERLRVDITAHPRTIRVHDCEILVHIHPRLPNFIT